MEATSVSPFWAQVWACRSRAARVTEPTFLRPARSEDAALRRSSSSTRRPYICQPILSSEQTLPPPQPPATTPSAVGRPCTICTSYGRQALAPPDTVVGVRPSVLRAVECTQGTRKSPLPT